MELISCVHLSCQLMPQMITVLTKYFPQQPCSVLFQRRESQDLEATVANISTDNLCTYQMPNDFIYHQAISENFCLGDAQNIPQALSCPAVATYVHV